MEEWRERVGHRDPLLIALEYGMPPTAGESGRGCERVGESMSVCERERERARARVRASM